MDTEGEEYVNHEIFMISIFIDFIEVEDIKSRRYILEYKLSDIKMHQITEVDIEEGTLHTEIQTGSCVFARLDMFNAFQQTPLYIFLNDAKHKAHCACGLDVSSMLVDAYKNSGEKYTYSINLPLENKSRTIIGRTNIEISVIHMSSDIDKVECIDYIPQEEQFNEEKDSNKVEVVETKTIEKKKKKKLPRVNPRSADVYQLNLQFRKTRQNLINEMAELEEKIRRIETSKRKQKYKKQKPIIDLDQTPQHESVHSRRSSFISQQIEFDDHDSLGDELVHMLDEEPDETFKKGTTAKAQTSYPKSGQNKVPNSLTAVGKQRSSSSSEEHTEAQWNTKFGSSSQSTSSLSSGQKIDVDSSTIVHTIDQTHDTFADTKGTTFGMTSTTQSGFGSSTAKKTMSSSHSKPVIASKSSKKSESSTMKSAHSKPEINALSSSSFDMVSSDDVKMSSSHSKHSSKSKTKPKVKESSSGFSQIASSTNSRSAVKTDLSNESSSGFSSLMASQSKSKVNTDLVSTMDHKSESKANSVKDSDSGFSSLISTKESKSLAKKDSILSSDSSDAASKKSEPKKSEKKKSESSSETDLSGILSMPSKSDPKSSTTKDSAITGLSSVLGSTLKKDSDDDSFNKLMDDSAISKKSESTTLSVLKSTNSKLEKNEEDSKLSSQSKLSKKSQNYSSIISDFD